RGRWRAAGRRRCARRPPKRAPRRGRPHGPVATGPDVRWCRPLSIPPAARSARPRRRSRRRPATRARPSAPTPPRGRRIGNGRGGIKAASAAQGIRLVDGLPGQVEVDPPDLSVRRELAIEDALPASLVIVLTLPAAPHRRSVPGPPAPRGG